mmetsp:Transcript_16031/g.41543  ORF Transcript_16031/g.41543 Transcript_16031/m.41543 type:complete len:327 (+) Transcript_16031:131-1111(+)
MATMKAWVVRGGSAEVEQVPVPVPDKNEALIKTLIVGMCNTDLEIMKGYKGFSGILGHEFVGEVTQCESKPELVGKRVVGEINLACCNVDECTVCAKGGVRARNHCRNRTVLGILKKDGTYAEFLTLPVRNLFVVPDGVTTENAAFTEPLAAALRIREQGVVRPGDGVAVVGDGKLGLLCAITLAIDGHHPVLIGRHPEKMALAKGVNAVMAADALPKHAGAFDVVVDATGNPEGLALSQQLCCPLGTLVLKSTCAAGATFNTAPYVIDELKVVGSRCGPFDAALEVLGGGLDLTPLITETVPFSEVDRAVALAGTKGTLKVQLRM